MFRDSKIRLISYETCFEKHEFVDVFSDLNQKPKSVNVANALTICFFLKKTLLLYRYLLLHLED